MMDENIVYYEGRDFSTMCVRENIICGSASALREQIWKEEKGRTMVLMRDTPQRALTMKVLSKIADGAIPFGKKAGYIFYDGKKPYLMVRAVPDPKSYGVVQISDIAFDEQCKTTNFKSLKFAVIVVLILLLIVRLFY